MNMSEKDQMQSFEVSWLHAFVRVYVLDNPFSFSYVMHYIQLNCIPDRRELFHILQSIGL